MVLRMTNIGITSARIITDIKMAVTDSYRAKYQSVADGYAAQYKIPAPLLSAVISKESSWNPYAVGSAGEIGLGQLKTGTASDLGVNPWNPAENIKGTAAYLAQQFAKFGNWSDALGAYNQGAGNYNNENAQTYASSILGTLTGPDAIDPNAIATGSPDAPVTGFAPFDYIVSKMSQYTFGIGGLLIGAALIAFGLYAMVMTAPTIKKAIGHAI